MKKKRTFLTFFLVIVTIALLATTIYISRLLSSTNSPTQIKKTKAAAVTYSKKVDLYEPPSSPTAIPADVSNSPTITPSIPTITPNPPTSPPTPYLLPTAISTIVPIPTSPPLLAYNSTTTTPTLIPTSSTKPTVTLIPTKKVSPSGVQQLPQTGWIQTSSILFIVAASTILFSLLF